MKQDLRHYFNPDLNTVAAPIRNFVVSNFVPPKINNHLAASLMGEIDNPRLGLNKLGMMIRNDSVLCPKVIEAANSPAYFDTDISVIDSIDLAVVRLGSKNLKKILSVLFMEGFFQSENPLISDILKSKAFRYLATAELASRFVATFFPQHLPPISFLSGITIDIGEISIIQLLEKHPDCNKIIENPELLAAICYPMHEKIGLKVLKEYKLPAIVSQCCSEHLKPWYEQQNLAFCISLADYLISASGIGHKGYEINLPELGQVLTKNSIAPRVLKNICLGLCSSIRAHYEKIMVELIGHEFTGYLMNLDKSFIEIFSGNQKFESEETQSIEVFSNNEEELLEISSHEKWLPESFKIPEQIISRLKMILSQANFEVGLEQAIRKLPVLTVILFYLRGPEICKLLSKHSQWKSVLKELDPKALIDDLTNLDPKLLISKVSKEQAYEIKKFQERHCWVAETMMNLDHIGLAENIIYILGQVHNIGIYVKIFDSSDQSAEELSHEILNRNFPPLFKLCSQKSLPVNLLEEKYQPYCYLLRAADLSWKMKKGKFSRRDLLLARQDLRNSGIVLDKLQQLSRAV